MKGRKGGAEEQQCAHWSRAPGLGLLDTVVRSGCFYRKQRDSRSSVMRETIQTVEQGSVS